MPDRYLYLSYNDENFKRAAYNASLFVQDKNISCVRRLIFNFKNVLIKIPCPATMCNNITCKYLLGNCILLFPPHNFAQWSC